MKKSLKGKEIAIAKLNIYTINNQKQFINSKLLRGSVKKVFR